MPVEGPLSVHCGRSTSDYLKGMAAAPGPGLGV
jgi:hypothetical protein